MPKDEVVRDVAVLAVHNKKGEMVGFWLLDDHSHEMVLHGCKRLNRQETKDLFQETLAGEFAKM